MSGYASSTSLVNPISLKRVNTSLNYKALTSRLGLSDEDEKQETKETVNLDGEGYSITFEIPNKNEGWRVDKEYEDVDAFYNALSVTSTKVTDIVGAGLPTRKTDIDMKEFDNLMKAEIGIQFTSNIGSYNPLVAANNRDKAIKRAIEMHKEKIVDDMSRKYKTMMKKGVFDEETNKIRIQNIARCSFSKDILMEDKNFDKKLLNNQHLKPRSGPPGNITPRQKSMPGKKEDFQYGFLSGLYSTNDDEKPQNPSSVLTKVPTASEKRVFKSFEETNQTKFLDKILSYNMTPATTLSRNPFLSEEVKMVMDRDLGDVGSNGPRIHKDRGKQEKPSAVDKKVKVKDDPVSLRDKQKHILEARKRKLSEASKQTEAEQINTTATKIMELTKYDPTNCGEKTLTEIMPSLDYSISQMLEKILELEELQEEEDILCYLNVKPAFADGGILKDNTLDAFLYGTLDTKTDPDIFSQREQFLMQEFKEFNPKEIEKQKQNLTQANIKNTKLTMDTLERYKEEKNQGQFEQLFSAKQKLMKDEEWQERDKYITEMCQSLEKLIVDMCNEMKKMNENKLISAVTPRYSVLDDMATTMVTILKCIPFDWNPRTKREWSQGAEVLLMWSMKLSSTLNINRHEHIIKLAKFYVNIFFENEVLMNNLFEHYKEVVIDEIKKPKLNTNEDDEEEELKLPKINTFSEWKNPDEDDDEDDSDSGERMSPTMLSHNLELKRRRVSRIKHVLFIIINYINHCNTYTQDVFKQIVQKEKQKFKFEKAIKEKSLKETGKQELVQSFLEKRGLLDITNYIKNTDWKHDSDTMEENLPRDHIDTEVRKEKEIDLFANIIKRENDHRTSKSNLKGSKHNKSTPRIPTDLPTSRSTKSKDPVLKKTLVVGDIPEKPPLEYQRSYYIEPPKGIPYFPTKSTNEPVISSKTKIDTTQPMPDIMASENSLMFTGSDHSNDYADENQSVTKSKQTDDSILDQISDIEHKSLSRQGSNTFSEDAVMHEDMSNDNEEDHDLEVKEDHQEPIAPTPKPQYHPEEVNIGTPGSDAISLHSMNSDSSMISTKSNDHDNIKIKKPSSKKRTTPDVTSIHEKKSKNLRRYTLQKRSTSSASGTTTNSQNSRNTSRASERNETPPPVEPKKSSSPVKLTAKNLELSNQLNQSMTTPLSEADTNSDILRVSIRSSTSIILKDDSPRSTKTPRSRRSLPSSEKKNPHSGKWAIKTSIFQNMFDNSTLFTGDDSPRRLDNNVDRFDSVTLLEKLEQVWDDLLIPAGFKIKLYQRYGSSKYIGNVNLMKDAYKTWKQGATVVAARETVLMELKEFENTLNSNIQKLTTFSDKVQEQKLRSTLFKRLSILGTECEKLNRKLKKDHNDNLSYNSEMPYIDKMKYDYLSIIAGIESLTEKNQPIDVNTSIERLRSPNKKTADVTKVDLILSYEK
ncbi:predicted protein [Naegleria gruberi]|uniref:Predicted protein n=1 Tax=Naegleria gruberi TaxID=5762 RepID=D2VC35_NAEGR|nr:uncharacterized protein NAEGRDRAFT_48335 [Naegleria gruberi]EFC45678.1 predicted protein [Naegleria gruberi]|eukprot:XP_002678422.1 predicted protein [Naegleria gruberi strain NEG-M]